MRKKFILHLRTPKGDRRLEQVATSPREALQEAFGALGAQLPPGLPDDARCRLECDGHVLGFCPDELGVLSGALHADEDVLDRVDRRPKKDPGTPSYVGGDYWARELMKQLMEETMRRTIQEVIYRRIGIPPTAVGAAPGHVHAHAPNMQQPPPGWLSPRTYDPPDAGSYASGGTVKIDGQTYKNKITGIRGCVSPFPWVPTADSTAPPPAPSAPVSDSTTDAPARTPAP